VHREKSLLRRKGKKKNQVGTTDKDRRSTKKGKKRSIDQSSWTRRRRVREVYEFGENKPHNNTVGEGRKRGPAAEELRKSSGIPGKKPVSEAHTRDFELVERRLNAKGREGVTKGMGTRRYREGLGRILKQRVRKKSLEWTREKGPRKSIGREKYHTKNREGNGINSRRTIITVGGI